MNITHSLLPTRKTITLLLLLNISIARTVLHNRQTLKTEHEHYLPLPSFTINSFHCVLYDLLSFFTKNYFTSFTLILTPKHFFIGITHHMNIMSIYYSAKVPTFHEHNEH
jgi:hypothetical protein